VSQSQLVAVDIGGTHTRMAVFANENGKLRQLFMKRYLSREFSDFVAVARNFLGEWDGRPPEAMAIGVAGPVLMGEVRLTNLAWHLQESKLASELGMARGVYIVNDLTAHAHGLSLLTPQDFLTIQPGLSQTGGNIGVIASGTGLGQAVGFEVDGELVCSPSEGGHCDFGPGCEADMRLWQFLAQRYDHVSWERVISGKLGFVNLYRFHTLVEGMTPIEELEKACEGAGDLSPALREAASDGHPTAIAVVKMFSRLYGAEAGNLALKVMASGGIYVLGGVSRAFKHWVCGEEFVSGFTSKGRFTELMRTIPVRLVVAEGNGLRGAALFGLQKLKKAAA